MNYYDEYEKQLKRQQEKQQEYEAQQSNAQMNKNQMVANAQNTAVRQNYSALAEANNPSQENDWVADYDQYQAKQAATPNQPLATTQASQPYTANSTDYQAQANAQSTQSPAYNSQWQAELDGIMNKIMNREKFSYDMNGDAMYQQYRDIYQNQANLGMQNAMAQAAALTGGYGSSYGQMVGQQMYAQQMQGLNDIGMDLYNQAYNQYMNEGDLLASQYSMLADREAQDYSRYLENRNYEYQQQRDTVGDTQWQQSMDYQQDRANVADEQWNESFAYQQSQDALGQQNYENEFAYQQDRDAVADAQWQENLQYQKDRDAVTDAQWQQSMDYQELRDAVADDQWNRQFASSEEQRAADNAYREALQDYQQSRDEVTDAQWRETMDYQEGRDAVYDAQWQAELNRALANDEITQEQWQAEMDRALANDKISQQNYQKEFEYQQTRDKADDTYRDNALKQDQSQFEALYGDKGYYVSEAAKDRAHDVTMQDDAQKYQSAENALDRSHDTTLQNDAQKHQEDMADTEYERMYGELEYDKNGNIIGGGYYTKQSAQDQSQFNALYGEKGYYATEAAKDRTHQSSEAAKDRAHDVTMQNDAQAHQEDMADTEYDRMYGELEYDENGNIVDGGFYTKQNAADNEYRDDALEQDQNQFDALYGEDGYYATENELNRQHDVTMQNDAQAHQSAENVLNRTHETTMQNDAQDFTQSENALDRTHQTTLQNDAQDHDVSMQDDAQKHQSDMYDKEYDDMYGELEYDENGNIVDGGFYTKQAEQSQENWQAEFDRQGEWYDNAQTGAATTVTYEGGGVLNGQTVPAQLAGVSGLTTTRTSLFDEDGVFKKAAVVRKNIGEGQDGTITYNIDGKEITLQAGTNPYTNSVNPDAKSGTFDNGYQPNSVASWYPDENGNPDAKKGQLTKTNKTDTINGVEQNVWKTPDGYEWIWDGANNTYRPYGNNQKTPSAEVSSFLAGTGISPSTIKYQSVK